MVDLAGSSSPVTGKNTGMPRSRARADTSARYEAIITGRAVAPCDDIRAQLMCGNPQIRRMHADVVLRDI